MQDLHGRWLAAAVDWPDGEPGQPGADGAGQDWVQDDFPHAGFAAVQWGLLKAEDVEYVGAGQHWDAHTAEQGSQWKWQSRKKGLSPCCMVIWGMHTSHASAHEPRTELLKKILNQAGHVLVVPSF